MFERGLGELSLLGAAKMAISAPKLDPRSVGPKFLVDHSTQKAGGSKEMFGIELDAVNPYQCFKGFHLRLLVFFSLVLRRQLRRELVAIAVAESLRQQIDDSTEIYLWNPYNLVGFAMAELLSNVHVYVLAPEYPPARKAVAIYSNETILDIQDIGETRRRLVVRRHNFISSEFKFVFYLSSAAVVQSSAFEEHALLNLFDQVRLRAQVPVEVRLHYYDLEHGLAPSLERRLGSHVVRDGRLSLEALSSNQISFSCHSSVGYELIGLGMVHMVIGPRSGGSREREIGDDLREWFASAKAVIPWDSLTELWASRLAEAYPLRLSWSGRNLLLDGRTIAAW